MKKPLLTKLRGFLVFALFLTVSITWAQMEIPTLGSTVTQNFNAMTGSALPAGFTVGGATSVSNSVTTLSSSSAGGSYKFTSSSDHAIGILNSSGYTSGKTIVLTIKNTTGATINNITIAWNYEKYRSGSREWTFAFSGGAAGNQVYAADSGNASVTFSPPGTVAKSVTLSNLTIADDATYTFTWTLTGTGGSTNGQALAIDDVRVTATANPSEASTIIRNTAFAEPQNINYANYQATAITASNSLEVGSFTIVDGGGTSDADNLATTLSAISFTVQNYQNIRKLAIYDGATEKAEIAVTGATATFSSLSSLAAADNSSKNFTLRATFNDVVTDNQQLRFTVASATTPTSNSSKFAATNAGAAATAITTNANRIEVTADRFVLVQQPTDTQVGAAMTPAVTATAKDALGNLDVDFASAVQVTSSGVLSGTPVSVNAVAGTVSFAGLVHTLAGTGLTLTLANPDNSWPATTGTFTIIPYVLTVDGLLANNKAYDATTTAQITYAGLNGIQNTDDVTIASYTADFEDENAGTGKTVHASVLLGGADAGKYTVAPISGLTADITPKEVTLTGVTAQNKDFDGNTDATLSGTAALVGILPGDVVTVNGTTATGQFVNAGPGGSIGVVVSGFVLEGADAANYTLVQPEGITANINDTGLQNQTITFSPLNAVTYGDAAFTLNATSSAGLPVTFTSSDDSVATISGSTVTITGAGTILITAKQAGDATHNPAVDVDQVLVVNQKTLTVTGATATTKVYDGTNSAEISGSLFGIVGTDVVTIGGTGLFTNENVNVNIPVTTAFTISGDDADNYTIQQPTDVTGNITPLALTLNNAVAQSKAYDGTASAVISGLLATIITDDDVDYIGTGTFASENVANGITVTATATLTGTDAGNYTLIQPTGLTADITIATLTITANAVSKAYDGTAVATVQNGAIVSGIMGSDDVTLAETTITGTFDSPAIGENKTVTATFTLAGTDAANYIIAPLSYTANITPAVLTADTTAATVTSKVYNGTNAAQISGIVLNGLVPGETVNATSGTFATATAGTNIPVTIVLTGTHAGNYTFTQPEPALTGTISKKGLTATAQDKSKVQGTANPALTIAYNGFITGETQANAAGFTAPVVTTSAVTTSPIGTYPISVSGGSATNYEFTTLTNGWLTVTGAAGSGNLVAWDFTGENNLDTSTAEVQDDNVDASKVLTRGAGAAKSAGANSFRTTGFMSNAYTTSSNDYFQFEVSASANYLLSISSINAVCRGTNTFGASVESQFAYSLNGTTFTMIGSPVVTTAGAGDHFVNVDVSGVEALQNVAAGTTVTFRYYAKGSTNTGGWGFYSSGAGNYGLAVKGSSTAAPVLPNITSALTDSSEVQSTDEYQITATGTPAITFTATNLPAGAGINNSGLISFDGTTPIGTYNIGLTATSFYGTSTKTLVYNVTKKNQVVTFDPDPIPVQLLGDAPFVFEVNNTALLPVEWASSDENVFTIAPDGTITLTGVGTATITASNNGNEIYNPVTATRTITVSAPCFEWTGTANSSWTNAANWCGGLIPGANRDVTIAASANNPVISTGVAYTKNLIVNVGATLTVATGATLSVEETLTVDNGATLSVEDNGALVQGENATANTNSGAINLTKKGSPMYRLDYALWSSPVAGQNLAGFSPATSTNRFYLYNTANSAYSGLTAATTSFETGHGYLIRMPNGDTTPGYNAGTAPIQHTGAFTGTPNNGNINLNLTNTGDRYNAVGNPYPSPVSVTDFFMANAGGMDITSGIYLWRKRNNGDNSSYATITLAAYAANPAEGGGAELADFFAGDNSTWTLAAGQGFLVRATTATSPQLHFTNSMRRVSPGASQAFFRQAAAAQGAPVSRLWVNLTSARGTASQTAIAYMNQATTGLDFGYDGEKFIEGTTITLYSLAQETPLAVQARPQFTATDVVPMGYIVPSAGTYTISLDRAQGVFAQGQNIYLKDKAAGTVTKLTEAGYSFVTEAGTINNRFEIVYTNEVLTTDNPVLTPDNVVVYTQNKTIHIATGTSVMTGVTVYDISGRKVYSQDNINNTQAAIKGLTAEQQVLIVQVDTTNGTVSKRIVY